MRAHGNAPAAIDHLRYALERDPHNVASFIQLAELLLQQGRIGEADVAASSALRLDPADPDALELKAEVAELRQRPDVALEMSHRLLAVDPGDTAARLRIAGIHVSAGEPGRAAPLLRAVIRSPQATDPQRAEAQWTLGIAYGAEERWPDAVAALADASRSRANMAADDWYRLAFARVRAGDLQGAQDDLRQALRAEPNHGPAEAMQAALHDRIRLQSYARAAGHSLPDYPAPDGWPATAPQIAAGAAPALP